MMLVTLDNLASRYHCLPSEAMARATTFDLKVLDIGAKWSNWKDDQREGKTQTTAPARDPSDYSMDELMKIHATTK